MLWFPCNISIISLKETVAGTMNHLDNLPSDYAECYRKFLYLFSLSYDFFEDIFSLRGMYVFSIIPIEWNPIYLLHDKNCKHTIQSHIIQA